MAFNVLIATPSTGNCKSAYAVSLARLVAFFAQTRIWQEIDQQYLDVQSIEGSGIAANREALVRMALAKPDLTHVLWIDEDMGFRPDVLHVLAAHRQPIVGCNYRMRFPPADFTALNLAGTERVVSDGNAHGLQEVTYCGFGMCLMERRVFESVPEPRFLQVWSDGHYSTEDSPFFAKCRAAGFKVYIDHDASRRVWHRGDLNYHVDEDYSELNARFRSSDGK